MESLIQESITKFLNDCAEKRNQMQLNLIAAFIQETGHKPSELVLVEKRKSATETVYYFAPKKEFE